jgi:hypothetical protein
MIHYNKEIEVAGIILRDPVTALTNIGIFAAGLLCYLRLRKQKLDFPNKNWIYFFLLMGISSLVAVIVHGFSYYTPPEVHFKIWWVMCVLQGAGVTLAQFGFASNVLSKYRMLVISVVTLQFGVFALCSYIFGTFTVAKFHLAAGLVPIMLYYIYVALKGKRAEMLVATGIGISALTALVHGLKLSISLEWFNYNDIAHCLIIASLVVMGRGVSLGLHEKRHEEQTISE